MTYVPKAIRVAVVVAISCAIALGVGTIAQSQNNGGVPAVVSGQDQSAGAASKGNMNNNMGPVRHRRMMRRNREGSPDGAKWAPGKDNSQNTHNLKSEMKVQERRERRQYEQAQMQVKDQQQQQYEKDVLQKLGSQRPEIKEGRQDIKKVRQETGANGPN